MLAVDWELSQGDCQPGASVPTHMGSPAGLLGLPHRMVAGLQEQMLHVAWLLPIWPWKPDIITSTSFY